MLAASSNRQRGTTLLELAVGVSLMGLMGAIAGSIFEPLGATQRSATTTQTLTSMADQILNGVARELGQASPDTLVIDPASPGILGYRKPDLNQPVDADGVPVLGPFNSLRSTLIPGTNLLGVEVAAEDPGFEDFAATAGPGDFAWICHRDNKWSGGLVEWELSRPQVIQHMNHGDTFGKCPSPLIVIGSFVAAVDPVDATLPGLHFNVRTKNTTTLVDVTLTVEMEVRGEIIQHRLSTTFRVGEG